MIRRATVSLMLVAGMCAAGEAVAQTPTSVNLIQGDYSRNHPGPAQQDLRQQDLRQQDLAQPDLPQRPIASKDQAPQDRQASGNPLWEIPLATLAVTRERPIFSASRRPAAQAVAAPVIESALAPVVEAAEAESPPLTLLGTVIDSSESLAIFFSQASNSVVRRHVGEEEAGWILQSIDVRTTTLEKDSRQATLALAARNAERVAQSEPPAFPSPGASGLPAPLPIVRGARPAHRAQP